MSKTHEQKAQDEQVSIGVRLLVAALALATALVCCAKSFERSVGDEPVIQAEDYPLRSGDSGPPRPCDNSGRW